jgi:adenylate dimethylallyltransferase
MSRAVIVHRRVIHLEPDWFGALGASIIGGRQAMNGSALHLVLGPTASSKTARSVDLAAALRAPVVAVDRIQVFDDLATISGRPTTADLRGTRRVYLDRRLAQQASSDLSATEGIDRLERLTAELGPTVILEGGSISLWRSFFDRLDGARPPGRLLPRLRVVRDWDAHARTIRDRCIAMMTTTRPSMLDELALTLSEPRSRALVSELIGVESALNWCTEHGVAPETLGSYRDDRGVAWLIASSMTPALVEYARLQQQTFADLLDGHPHEVEVVH